MDLFWTWIAGLVTIIIFSYVYKENRLYRFVEHVYIGTTAGYAISVNYNNLITRIWVPLADNGDWMILIPTALGILMFTRFFKSVSHYARWTTAFLVALGAGLSLYGVADAQLRTQISATFMPLFASSNGSFNLLETINNWIIIFGVCSVITYFFFSNSKTNAVISTVQKGGRFLMMISFGIAFGNGVMMNMSLLLGCFETILGTLGIGK